MAQNTLLAPGTNAGTSLPVAVDTVPIKVGIYCPTAGGDLPAGVRFALLEATPGADNVIGYLDAENRSRVVDGRGTYKVGRPAYNGPAFGVYSEEP